MSTEETKKQQQVDQVFYTQTTEEVLQNLNTTVNGLTEAEAKKRLAEYGSNELDEGKKTTTFQKLLAQFKDLMIIVLIAAAAISALVPNAEGHREWVDALIILAVVIINAIMGVIQENKAEQAIEALKEMSTPNANVLRDGHNITVNSHDLVPGDIVLLEAGEVVPADMRLIELSTLKI